MQRAITAFSRYATRLPTLGWQSSLLAAPRPIAWSAVGSFCLDIPSNLSFSQREYSKTSFLCGTRSNKRKRTRRRLKHEDSNRHHNGEQEDDDDDDYDRSSKRKHRNGRHSRNGSSRRRSPPQNADPTVLCIYVPKDPPSDPKYDARILGVHWTQPSAKTSEHPTVRAVLEEEEEGSTV